MFGSPVLTSAAVRTTQTTALCGSWQADETAITVLEEGIWRATGLGLAGSTRSTTATSKPGSSGTTLG